MHLRSITLKGFKSFPTRTRLEFGPGVSVIVGPNGSGKSNITDAVLWALGEQSPLAVRGQSMKDVIFAGGHGVPGSGAAEVEVVIENGDGRLDADFAEISIVRRLERDGEGEYRLNGARCRLVDVIEVLSDSGLGKEMHSVVSQGKVEQIVLSRPRDRRLMIRDGKQSGHRTPVRIASGEATAPALFGLPRRGVAPPGPVGAFIRSTGSCVTIASGGGGDHRMFNPLGPGFHEHHYRALVQPLVLLFVLSTMLNLGFTQEPKAILAQLGIPFELAAPSYVEHDPPDADAVALVLGHRREVDPRIGHGLLAGGHREMDEAGHPAGHLRVHRRVRVEVERARPGLDGGALPVRRPDDAAGAKHQRTGNETDQETKPTDDTKDPRGAHTFLL
mgnify:CR=1 FL=1